MIDIFKKLFNENKPTEAKEISVESAPPPAPVVSTQPSAPPVPKKSVQRKKRTVARPKVEKTPKEYATEKREPYVSVIKVDLDPENIGAGSFELDWNEYFIAKLIKSGYKGTDDSQIVDQWFQDVCRNVVMETFEQYEANNPRPVSGVQKRDIGSGRTEIS
jgi:hypothetical protein